MQVIDAIPNAPLQCQAEVSLGVRRSPDVYAGRTERIVEPGEVFLVSRRIAADDRQQIFYELADGSGWVFRLTPQGGVCVKELTPRLGDGGALGNCLVM
jgi:hypothetical protein